MRDPIRTPEPDVTDREPVAPPGSSRAERSHLRPAGGPVGPAPRPRFGVPPQRWQDWANLILGAWFFVAAWIITDHVGLAGDRHMWNNWVAGGLVFLASLWALARPRSQWPEWCNLIFGAWIFISPWVLHFAGTAGENWNAWIVGAVIFLIALWALSLTDGGSFARTRRPVI